MSETYNYSVCDYSATSYLKEVKGESPSSETNTLRRIKNVTPPMIAELWNPLAKSLFCATSHTTYCIQKLWQQQQDHKYWIRLSKVLTCFGIKATLSYHHWLKKYCCFNKLQILRCISNQSYNEPEKKSNKYSSIDLYKQFIQCFRVSLQFVVIKNMKRHDFGCQGRLFLLLWYKTTYTVGFLLQIIIKFTNPPEQAKKFSNTCSLNNQQKHIQDRLVRI